MDSNQALSGIDLSSLIDTLSKNPEIINAAKDMLSSVQKSPSPPESEKKTEGASQSISALPNELTALLPALSSVTHSHHSDRDALLNALRPYLSSARCETLDRILSIEKLGAILSGIEKGKGPNGAK